MAPLKQPEFEFLEDEDAKRTGYKYRVTEALTYTLPFECALDGVVKGKDGMVYAELCEGVLTIFAGYMWNGADYAVDTIDFLLGSLLHDAIYQMGAGKERKERLKYKRVGDRVLFHIIKKVRMGWFRRLRVHFGVHFGGRARDIYRG